MKKIMILSIALGNFSLAQASSNELGSNKPQEKTTLKKQFDDELTATKKTAKDAVRDNPNLQKALEGLLLNNFNPEQACHAFKMCQALQTNNHAEYMRLVQSFPQDASATEIKKTLDTLPPALKTELDESASRVKELMERQRKS